MAQPFEKKQITNFNYDSRGASFPIYPFSLSSTQISPIFFEAHEGNISNIMMMSYDSFTDSFFNPIPLTQNDAKNIKPIAWGFDYYPSNKINLIWQTNENGNWDIAMRTLNDSGWTEKRLLLNSPEDETNPSCVVTLVDYYWYNNEFELLYEKNNSVYLYYQRDTIVKNEVIFEGNDTIIYSQPTGAYVHQHNGSSLPILYVAASEKKGDETSIVKYRTRSNNNFLWSDIRIAYDSVFADNPKFFRNHSTLLSFETNTGGLERVNIFRDADQIGNNWEAIPLIDNPLVQCSDFTTQFYMIRTYKQTKIISSTEISDFDTFLPYSFKMINDYDSVFIICITPYPDEQLFFTKVRDTKIGLGNLGMSGNQAISYTVWEDSANGKINLFGMKRLDGLGDIDDKIIANNFILHQNFPNPFNPKTILKYELLSRDLVTLKIYDVLGNEIAALVNEEKDAGVYNTTFDGINLTSGIYMYRLSVGKNHLSKKMVLLK